MKILLAVDGSEHSTRAAKFVVNLAKQLAEAPELVVVHVDEPLLNAVAVKLGTQGVNDYHADNARFAFKGARATLSRAKLEHETLALVGQADRLIAETATKRRADLVVMGSHGRTALSGLLLGSVTTKVIAQSKVPVTVVR